MDRNIRKRFLLFIIHKIVRSQPEIIIKEQEIIKTAGSVGIEMRKDKITITEMAKIEMKEDRAVIIETIETAKEMRKDKELIIEII